jgi:hypothetical protein
MAFDWDPGDHPRWPNGRFRPKVSQSVRVSPISISYNAGVRIPIIPGRANVYAGALFRLERARGGDLFKRQTDAAINRIFGSRKDGVFATLLKDREVTLNNGVKLRGPKNVINTPSFRVSKAGGGGKPAPQRHYAPGGKSYVEVPQAITAKRAPRRKPRVRSASGRRVSA